MPWVLTSMLRCARMGVVYLYGPLYTARPGKSLRKANATISSDPPRAHPLLGLDSLTETLTKFRSLVTALASLPIPSPLPQSLNRETSTPRWLQPQQTSQNA